MINKSINQFRESLQAPQYRANRHVQLVEVNTQRRPQSTMNHQDIRISCMSDAP